jgi:hypothetical protein
MRYVSRGNFIFKRQGHFGNFFLAHEHYGDHILVVNRLVREES